MTMGRRQWQTADIYPARRPRGRQEPAEARLLGLYAPPSDPVHAHDDRYFTETESDARFSPIVHAHKDSPDHNHNSAYAALNHSHDEFNHTHPEFSDYAQLNHTHSLPSHTHAPVFLAHTHDDRYYQKPTSDSRYARRNHDHDYLTELRGRQLFSRINHEHDDENTADHQHDSRYYTKTYIDTSYYTRSDSDFRYARVSHSHRYTGGGTPAAHNHDSRYYTESESNTRFARFTHSHGTTGDTSPHTHNTSHNHDTRYARLFHSHTGRGDTTPVADSGLWGLTFTGSYEHLISYSRAKNIAVPGIVAQSIYPLQYVAAEGTPTIGRSDSRWSNIYVSQLNSLDTVTTTLETRHLDSGRFGADYNLIKIGSRLEPRIHYADSAGVWFGTAGAPWRRGYFDRLWVDGREITRGGSGGGNNFNYDDVLVLPPLSRSLDHNNDQVTLSLLWPMPNPNTGLAGDVVTVNVNRNGYMLTSPVTTIDGGGDGSGGTVHPHEPRAHLHGEYSRHGHNHSGTYSLRNHTHPASKSIPDHTHDAEDGTVPSHRHSDLELKDDNITLQLTNHVADFMTHTHDTSTTHTHKFGVPTSISTRNYTGNSHNYANAWHEHNHPVGMHEYGGSRAIDGDRLRVGYEPTNYARTISVINSLEESTLASHLHGINQKLGTIATPELDIPWLAVPSSILPDTDDSRFLGTATKRWSNVWTRYLNSDSINTDVIYTDDIRSNEDEISIHENVNLQEHSLKNLARITSVSSLSYRSPVLEDFDDAVPHGSLFVGLGDRPTDTVSTITSLLDLIPGFGALISGAASIALSNNQSGTIFLRMFNRIYVFESDYSFDASGL